MSEDAHLVARIQSGDLSAFEALYDKYKGQVFRTALAITRDRDAAEEILQDCFLRAYKHANHIDGYSSLSAWLHRIAVNLSYNWMARRRPWLAPLEGVIDRLIASPKVTPEAAAERGEVQRIVRDAVDALDFRHRVVIVLFYRQGFNLAEIAYILDCPVGTVKSRLHYAREELRKRLEADERLPVGMAYELP